MVVGTFYIYMHLLISSLVLPFPQPIHVSHLCITWAGNNTGCMLARDIN